MIGKRQLALVNSAREKLKLADEDFTRMLATAGAERPEDLAADGFAEFMDECTILGFRDVRRPILSADTRRLLDEQIVAHGMTSFARATLLRHYGRVGDLRELDGMGLCHMLARLEKLGSDIPAFIDNRRSVTPKQLGLLHVAREKVDMDQEAYSVLLVFYGGVNTAADLDQRGFDLAMARMRRDGFEMRKRALTPAFGPRPGFASPAQLGLIRELWAEWSDGSDEAGLVTWLERSYQVSALRFLKADTASKAITALKAMKRRKAEPSKVKA